MQTAVNGTAFVADRILAATGLGAIGAGLLAETTDIPIPKNGIEYISFGVLAFVLLAWAKARVEAAELAWQEREKSLLKAHAALEAEFKQLLLGSVTTHRDALTANTAALDKFQKFLDTFSEGWQEVMETRPCVALDPAVRERLHSLIDDKGKPQATAEP